MDSLRSLLPGVLSKRGLKHQAQAAHVVFLAGQWIHNILPAFKDSIRVEKLKDGTLWIACGHSVAAQECQERASDLLHELEISCPDMKIREVRVRRS